MSKRSEYLPDPNDAAAVTPPPHSIEAEQGVIGCLLLAPVESAGICRETMRGAPVFDDPRHATIYAAAVAMVEEFKGVDLVTLAQKLKDLGELDRCGGLTYLAQLADAVPSAANLPHYLDILLDKWRRRALLTALRAADGQLGGSYEVKEIAATLQDSVDTILAGQDAQKARHLKAILLPVIDSMEKYFRGKAQLSGLSTGLPYMDKVLMGIAPNDMTILAGRPGDGKTSLAMNIVEYLCGRYEWWTETGQRHEDGKPVMQGHKGINVCVFSLEMTGESLVKRLLFGHAQVCMGTWNTGMASNDDLSRITKSAVKMMNWPGNLYIDDISDATIEQIRSRARRMVKEHNVGLFVLDYIQLLDMEDGRYKGDRVKELTRISKAIVALKKQLNVPWLVLAQMNRNIEQSEGKRVPILSDLKDCGAFEQDADKVLMLYRPFGKQREQAEEWIEAGPWEKVQQKNGDWHWKNLMEIPQPVYAFCAKNRTGPTGNIELLFFKNQTRFEDFREWRVKHNVEQAAKGERYQTKIDPDDVPVQDNDERDDR